MQSGWVAVAVLGVLLLSGCTGSDGGARSVPQLSESRTGPVQPPLHVNASLVNGTNAAFDAPFGGQGCSGGQVWLSINPGLVQSVLPKGFVVGDSTKLVGPIGSGRAVVTLEVYSCRSTEMSPSGVTFGVFGAYIEPPKVAGDRPKADTDWYQFALFTPNEALSSLLHSVGFKQYKGDVTSNLLSVPDGPSTDDGAAKDDGGVVFDFKSVTTVAQRQLTFSKRVWQQEPLGVTYFEYAVKSDVVEGTATCDIRSGSIVWELSRNTSCTPAEEFYGYVWNDTEWTGRIVYRPGVRPA